MLLARVEGNLVATRKHPSFEGWRLVICQPVNGAGAAQAAPLVAIGSLGAGMGQHVIISSDGAAARQAVGDPKSPVRWMIIGILDDQGLSTRQAEAQTGIAHSDFSRIRRVKLDRFTIDRLIAILNRLNQRVDFRVNVIPTEEQDARAL